MNLLEQYKKLQKENLSKNGDMQLGIAYKKENGLTTVKYLHGGVDFSNPLYRNARGLTLDLKGNVISRGFEKFFNWKGLTEYENYSKEFKNEYSEVEYNPNHQYNFYEKLDGSLILLAEYKKRFVAATTSSSYNPYTQNALKWFYKKENYKALLNYLRAKNITLAFEYISIKNPIVIHYTHTDYVLIGAHDNKTGKRYSQEKLNQIAKRFGFSQPKVYQYTFEEIKDVMDNAKDIEGFVLENTHGKLIKFKTEEWFRLKDYYGIFFGPLTNSKIATIIDSYLADEIDDLIAVEQQHEHYKDLGLLNTVLTHAKYFENEIQQAYEATKHLSDKELGLNWKDYIESYALPCVFNIRKGVDWRTQRKGDGPATLALFVQTKVKQEKEEEELNG